MTTYFQKLELLELSLSGKARSMSFSGAIASAATTSLQIKTSNETCIVLAWSVSSDGQPLTIVAKESPTVTDGTVEIPSYNLNRQNGLPVTKFYSNPTSISGGTTIYTEIIAGTKGSGGSLGSNLAWVLKKNTSYIWQITNTGNQSTNVSASLYFAEEVLP